MGTTIAILITLLMLFLPGIDPQILQDHPIPHAFAYFALALVITQLLILAASFLPLQKAEQNLTPGVLELYKNDYCNKWIQYGVILFTILLLLLTFYPFHLPIPPLLCGLIILGILFDLLYYQVKTIYNYLNPFPVAKMFTKAAEKSILQNHEMDLCESLESLSEISLKSLNHSSTTLCNQSLDEMREIIRLFLGSTKSIALGGQDEQAKAQGITDKVSYTLFFFFDRLNMIYQKALHLQLPQTCNTIVAMLGKITLYAARCDLSLVAYVVHYMGKFCIEAEKNKWLDIALKGTCTLVEVSKSIVSEIDLNYMDLKDPFFTIIAQLDEIGKETFRQNKQTNIAFLTAPFKDLKTLFQSPKVANHPDTPAILNELNRVLAEWSTLEAVMRTIPNISLTTNSDDSPQSNP